MRLSALKFTLLKAKTYAIILVIFRIYSFCSSDLNHSIASNNYKQFKNLSSEPTRISFSFKAYLNEGMPIDIGS